MIVLYRASNIIERDSLIAFLRAQGIEALTGRRDVVQNLTDNPNLSHQGYSAMFAGYEIFVLEEDLESAKKFLAQYQQQTSLQIVNQEDTEFSRQKQSERRLMMTAFLSLIVPVLAHALFIYLLIGELKNGAKFSVAFYIRALVIMTVTALFSLTLLYPQIWSGLGIV